MTSSVETSSLTERYTGRVKWFNSKTGYGFVTVTDGSKSGTDVFVHHSSVQVEKEQYRYLVQGEYIQFELSSMSGGSHEYQATNVTGVNRGQLMCESLLESGRQVRPYRAHQPREEYQSGEYQSREPRPELRTSSVPSGRVPLSSSGRVPSSGRGRGPSSGSGRGRGRGPPSGSGRGGQRV
jgi:CspA family cold shock protein